jgi:hypothetical protein
MSRASRNYELSEEANRERDARKAAEVVREPTMEEIADIVARKRKAVQRDIPMIVSWLESSLVVAGYRGLAVQLRELMKEPVERAND